ncbi:hypothetical protein [Rubellimicrobium sp. CFH 75288]|uniref:hypothetical protein n=1 Tax=Rubellimicrobium sp. CFH 75288 TaxID=2697034 RepID=UPI001412CC05|nr:hypothetical protein [Rubellimicrobium sp. CFH 75288]
MILPLLGLAIGAVLGTLAARRRGGKPADLVQWALVWALIGGLVGVFVTIAATRLA